MIPTTRVNEPLQDLVSAACALGQAQGVLIERLGLTPDVAVSVLKRLSQDTNTELRDLAATLVDSGELSGGTEPALLTSPPGLLESARPLADGCTGGSPRREPRTVDEILHTISVVDRAASLVRTLPHTNIKPRAVAQGLGDELISARSRC